MADTNTVVEPTLAPKTTKEKANIVIPHVAKVAIFIFLSGGLASIINGLGNFHFDPTTEMVVVGIINLILAAAKKWQDQP